MISNQLKQKLLDRINLLKARQQYEEFSRGKKNGTLKAFEQISRPELVQIWFIESKSDALIAELFNIHTDIVKVKRRQYGITLTRCLFELLGEVDPDFNKIREIILGDI